MEVPSPVRATQHPSTVAVARRTGAGCMVMSRRTGRFLFCLRPDEAPSGGTWSVWGGKGDPGEKPEETAIREVLEETGYLHRGELYHLHHLDTRTFSYHTFLMVVEDEFEPRPSSECAGYAWLPVEKVPSPMHWGLAGLLSDRTAVGIIARSVERISGRPCPLEPIPCEEPSGR